MRLAVTSASWFLTNSNGLEAGGVGKDITPSMRVVATNEVRLWVLLSESVLLV
jgi:hypothetical protein